MSYCHMLPSALQTEWRDGLCKNAGVAWPLQTATATTTTTTTTTTTAPTTTTTTTTTA